VRILMVSRGVVSVGPKSGGAEHACYELAKHLADEGDDVVLVSDVDASILDELPARLTIAEVGATRGIRKLVLRCPVGFVRWLLQHLVGNVCAARRASELLARDDAGPFDVVHGHGALSTILVAARLRDVGSATPLLYTEHDSTPWSCRYRRVAERVLRRCIYRHVNLRACRAASTVVTNYASLADELAMRTNMARSHFSTVRNGADLHSLYAGGAGRSVAEQHGVDHYCLFVGSLIDRKGPDVLIRALGRVEMPCIIVGDGPMRPALERLAASVGISERLIFTGALEPRDVRRYYDEAEVLVLPSVSEGVPLVALEALGAGVPVVASDLDGLASVVRNGENGLLVEPGEEKALVWALSLLRQGGSILASLQRGAMTSADDVPGWEDVAEQLHDLYDEVRETNELSNLDGHRDLELAGVGGLPALQSAVGLPWESFEAQQWRRAA
jgi:glycosyltransferase involved in cell wall biosynthesis